jgi:hypothetical protein
MAMKFQTNRYSTLMVEVELRLTARGLIWLARIPPVRNQEGHEGTNLYNLLSGM